MWNATGEAFELPLGRAEGFQVYRPIVLGVSIDERIRVTWNGRPEGRRGHLHNGSVYMVTGFTPDGNLVLDVGWVVGRSFGHLAYDASRRPAGSLSFVSVERSDCIGQLIAVAPSNSIRRHHCRVLVLGQVVRGGTLSCGGILGVTVGLPAAAAWLGYTIVAGLHAVRTRFAFPPGVVTVAEHVWLPPPPPARPPLADVEAAVREHWPAGG